MQIALLVLNTGKHREYKDNQHTFPLYLGLHCPTSDAW